MDEKEKGDGGQNIAKEGQTGHSGDGILNSDHIMGKDQGLYKEEFSKVSGIWIQDGCMPFDEAKDKLAKDQQQIHDIKGPLSDWKVLADNDGIVFMYRPTGQEFKPTDHALGMLPQVGQGMSQWGLRSLASDIPHKTKKDDDGNPETIDGGKRGLADYEVLRDYINIHLFHADRVDQEKERLFRTWENGTFRALLSSRYCIVNNLWFLDLLSQIIPGGLVSHWKGDADVIFGNILIPDTIRKEEDSDFGGMLSVGNSEIGTRRISSLPSVFRAICMNGCIWDQTLGKSMNKVHRGEIDFQQLAILIRENLEEQIPLLPMGIERVLGLRAFGCGDTPMTNILAQTAIDGKMSKKQVNKVAEGWQKEVGILGIKEGKTAYGLTNAITRAGQELDDNAQWVRFDTIGGEYASMDRDGWDKFRDRADGLTKKQVKSKLGELVAA